jgi:hypothetical protein
MAKSAASADRPAKLTIANTLAYIYRNHGVRGLYRGVTPRIGLGIWQTICMVSFADYVKIWWVSIPMSAIKRLTEIAGSKVARDPYIKADMTVVRPYEQLIEASLILVTYLELHTSHKLLTIQIVGVGNRKSELLHLIPKP